MSPRIFPVDGCLATSTRILSENRLSYCSASNSRAHRRGILPLAVSCFPAFWFGSQLPLKPRSTLSLSEVTPGLHGAGVQHFPGRLQQPERTAEGRELQPRFRQRCSESRCATPPADFNRCPTSFRRDHYRPVQPQRLLLRHLNLLLHRGVAPAAWASLSITDLLMRLYLPTAQLRPCSHGARREVLSFSTYPSETRLTESNPLPYRNCMLFWKSKCK